MAAWKPMSCEGCDFCGAACEVHTDSTDDAYYDGDSVRCTECGATGTWCVDEDWDEDDEPADTASVSWDDEPEAANAVEANQ